ncbi:hypothetical protein Amuc03_01916 [Akkermansia muciniphila]
MVSSGAGGIILVLLFKTTIFRILEQFMNAGCRRVMNLASLLRRKPHGFQIGDRHLGLLRLAHRLAGNARLNHGLDPRILINEHLALQRLQPRPHLGGGSDHVSGRNGHQGKTDGGILCQGHGNPAAADLFNNTLNIGFPLSRPLLHPVGLQTIGKRMNHLSEIRVNRDALPGQPSALHLVQTCTQIQQSLGGRNPLAHHLQKILHPLGQAHIRGPGQYVALGQHAHPLNHILHGNLPILADQILPLA